MNENDINKLLLDILQDVRYVTNGGEYEINDGGLIARKDTTALLQQIGVYIKFLTKNIKIYNNVETVNIDYTALYDALRRYSRDMWGYKRLNSLVSKIPTINSSISKEKTLEILEEAGLKVVSLNPYVERQCAYLLYWLCKSRPFSIKSKKMSEEEFHEVYILYNEMISFTLIQSILIKYGCKINIEEKAFKDIVRDLHYRVLGRTSLELLLTAIVNLK